MLWARARIFPVIPNLKLNIEQEEGVGVPKKIESLRERLNLAYVNVAFNKSCSKCDECLGITKPFSSLREINSVS